ncbi:secreted glycosyl hydrolase [Penicillium diatomitis]|uniref:Secreted glycosyl hydrolase n=1 Tax=Penicillium diatomitis TaxID=2819901 RepID=A0A9X0BNH1_9EURO|nr:secreted glycosyl hydrolase [Penicillium diatomitis]KAJ5475197.1 secreted glycosyl hydrolase [Penicillium diatomitis]
MHLSRIPQLLALFLSLASSTQAERGHDLAQEAGHHVIFSYPGISPPAHLFDLIKQGKVGGIILFGENVASNVSTIINQLQDAYKQSQAYVGSPLLIMTDQEGGIVRRLPGGPVSSAKQVGESGDPGAAAIQAGKDAAHTLAEFQVNTNLAPVLGIYREAGDFLDQYGRSYGNNSELVATCGSAFITAQQVAGVIATAKHFPGLGAAGNLNTDEGPVTIDLPLRELRAVDEAPYTNAIAAGVDMVMTSWAVYPALDATYPSGLSNAWVEGELRGRLGFRGVTITDALEAGALESFGDAGNRGLLASQAGMDVILASARDVAQGEAVVNALVSALDNGSLPRGKFTKATDRILALRRKITV